MKGTRIVAVLGMLFAVGCGAAPISVAGRVIDERGTAVAKAEISTQPETDVVVSNDRGFFVIRQRLDETGSTKPLTPGVYRLLVRHAVYQDLEAEVKLEEGPVKLPDLTLKPREVVMDETAPDPTAEQERTADDSSTPVQGN